MSRAQSLALLVLLILVAFALRLYRLDAFSFRGDEAFTVLNWVSRSLQETLASEIPLKDPQPPLTFALFRGWALLFGSGEFAMRLLPALLSIPGMAALYALALRHGGRLAALAAATLYGLHPFLIWHAQDAKPYAIWVSLSTIAFWLAQRALRRNRRLDWLLYVAAAGMAAYLYYLELLFLAALNLFVLASYRNQPRRLRRWIGAQLLIALLLAPWYLQERLLFGSGYGGTAGGLEPLRLFTWIMPALQFGRSLPLELLERSALLVGFALLAGLWFMARRHAANALNVGLRAFLPPLLLALIALRLDVFTPRYVLAGIPAFILLLPELWRWLWRRAWPARVLALVSAIAWLGLMLLSLDNAWFSPHFAKSPDWRGLVRYLLEEAGPNDLVVQTAADEAFTLYLDEQMASLKLPANPVQEPAEILMTLEAAAASSDSVWLVARAPQTWPNRLVGTDWLGRNMQLVRDTQIGGLPVRQYRPREVQDHELAASPLASFAGVADLTGVRLGRTPDALVVELIWRARGQSQQRLKGFVHLYDARGPQGGSALWAQDDRFIQDGRVDTRLWTAGTVLRDVYTLPLANVPPGRYVLHVGLYDPDSGSRLITARTTDSVAVGVIELATPAD